MASARPTLHAIVTAAVDATDATSGWLLRVDHEDLVVVAVVAEGPASDQLLGQRRRVVGTAGFVASSGQPAAIGITTGDEDNFGAGAAQGTPTSLLAIPCGDDDVVGVLEVANARAGSFTFDDVEVVSLLAEVAGAAFTEDLGGPDAPPSPEALGHALAALAAADPGRYAHIARAVEAMLG